MAGEDPTRIPSKGGEDDYVPFSDEQTAPAPPRSSPSSHPAAGDDGPTMPASATRNPIPEADNVTRVVSSDSRRPIPGVQADNRPTATHVPLNEAPNAGGDALIGRRLGGLVLKQKLGAGGMGAVYLARQVSLDRDVAVKLLPPQMAQNPDFVARFTREALTAAQLNHHNVIQVYDVGSEDATNFISMEFVRGDNLGTMTRKGGKLAFEDAAGYVLQAARGLAYAHERGVIHRDIKPDNLMVNEHGILKVADMGLAKIKGDVERSVGLDVDGAAEELKRQAYGNLTGASVAMGTPAYMAPEQGRDASKADHRADQYSLGCTLYYLVAGQTPYSGKTSFEIISKHLTEPLVPVEKIVTNVPRELSVIIQKMMAKDPAERYQSLHGVIDALEAYLGIDEKKGPYTPREHHVKMLEDKAKAFYEVSALKQRKLVRVGYLYGSAALFALGLFVSPFLASAALGLLVLTPIFNFIAGGIITKDYLFRRVRSVFFGMGLKGWASTLLWSLLGLVALYVFGLLGAWIAVAVLALGAAVAYQMVVMGRLRRERREHLDAVQELLKKLRINGISEENLQHFVSQYTGLQWEEFFENLFGYEAMLEERARLQRVEKVNPRKRYATWRDPLARWLDEVEEKRRKSREEKVLAKAEKQRLKAQGVAEDEAEKQAGEIAQQVLSEGLLKETVVLPAAPSRAEVEKVGMELHKASTGGKTKLLKVGFRALRAVGGLAMLVAGVAPMINQFAPLPEPLINLVKSYYSLNSSGQMFQYFSAMAGMLLFLTAFSSRVLFPVIVCLGAVIFAFMKVIQGFAGQPDSIMFWTAVGLAAGGFAMMVLAKLGGGKF